MWVLTLELSTHWKYMTNLKVITINNASYKSKDYVIVTIYIVHVIQVCYGYYIEEGGISSEKEEKAEPNVGATSVEVFYEINWGSDSISIVSER